MPCFARSLVLFLTCGTTKHTDNCDRKLSPHPTIFRPRIYLLLTKTAPPSLTVPPAYLTCFLGFSILIFHKCNIARILAVQQILHQVCGLKLYSILRVTVGALQECRIHMTQQRCRHLFAGAFLQQIRCVEMPQGVQVIIFREPFLYSLRRCRVKESGCGT